MKEEANLEEYKSWSDRNTSAISPKDAKRKFKEETAYLSPEKRDAILATHEAMKRKLHEDNFPEQYPMPMKRSKGPPQAKNAVQKLNEYKTGKNGSFKIQELG